MPVIERFVPAALVALLAIAPTARAQGTEESLKRATDLYNNFAIEQARPILLGIVSPNNPFPVTTEQKVRAYKYLGASYAVLDRRDSAVVYLSAAIDYDPFMDLDPHDFSAAELSAFNEARSKIFKMAIKPIKPSILDENFVFTLITTQRADLTVTIIKQSDSTQRQILFANSNTGIRDIKWDGRLLNGDRADSTLYELRVTAASGSQPASQLVKIEYAFAPLEDTLPSILASDLLPEQYEALGPWFDLAKGTAMAVAAIGLPVLALDKSVKWQAHAAVGAALGLIAGVGSFSYRRSHRSIPENVRENDRRQQHRAQFNAGVRSRNADRINGMTMLICPATGCPR